jgi:hypothetical protein
MKIQIAYWAMCLSLTACTAPLVDAGIANDQLSLSGIAVEIRRFGQPSDAMISAARMHRAGTIEVRDDESWRNLWPQLIAGHSPQPPRPVVNFNDEMLLGAFMGERPSAGYAIKIVSVRDLGETLLAQAVATSPAPQCAVLAVITSPVDIVRVDRTHKPVRWEVHQNVRSC